MSRSFFIGAFIAVAIRWAFLHPLKALLIIGGIVGSVYLLVGLDAANVSYQSNKAEGLNLSVTRQFGVEDGYGGSWRVAVKVTNETGRDISEFSARCGSIDISDKTGISAGGNETRSYEVGALQAGKAREVAACRFTDIEFGSPSRFDHAMTYGRMS